MGLDGFVAAGAAGGGTGRVQPELRARDSQRRSWMLRGWREPSFERREPSSLSRIGLRQRLTGVDSGSARPRVPWLGRRSGVRGWNGVDRGHTGTLLLAQSVLGGVCGALLGGAHVS